MPSGPRGGAARLLTELRATGSPSGATATLAPASSVPGPKRAMTGAEIREAFLSFFESKGHTRLPSSSLVPEDPTVLLTIAGMLQFKPVFLGQAPRKVATATTTQKCVRTNDIENVGVTARHHTFFEMLGNFSFGDYFKEQAIKWAWELSTGVFGIPPERIWVSVYEEDAEAEAIWRDVVGVAPERIKRMGAADNFWASGPTGPCGPCSELYYDFHPERGTAPEVSLEDDSRFIEFYNLVFMQLNRGPDGSLEPLAAKNIDTGMGLERMAQILQGAANNYETDLIFPIVAKAAQLAGVDYHTAHPATKTALKVIGDHTRAVTYMLSDGITPSNTGRGYVLRRLLRRVVMKGRLLGIRDLFTPAVAAVAVELSGPCDPAVAKNAQRIYDELAREEGLFVTTLERGQKQLDELLAAAAARAGAGDRVLSGPDAFMLYDTFGFPLELTQELAEAAGVTVDVAGFEVEMEAQRQRSKDSRESIDLTAQASLAQLAAQVGPTTFTGYSATSGTGRVVGLMRDGRAVEAVQAGETCEVLLDSTPFYAESGGQIGDNGVLLLPGASAGGPPAAELRVTDCQKAAGGAVLVHSCEVVAGGIKLGDTVTALVDAELNRRARAHHTATHLLQSALKSVLGPDTCQQGSLVNFQRLRFDFNLARGMTAAEVAEVERLVNSWVARAQPLQTKVMALADAKAAGATAMFGEKYDDEVRVVDVPGVSMELCGGTHVSNTAEIGAFKILSESGIASGIRRVEAVAGPAAVEYLNQVDGLVRGLAGQLKLKPEEVPARVSAMQSELREASKAIAELKAQLAVAQSQSLASQAVSTAKGAKLLVAELPGGVDAKALQEAAVSLQSSLGDPSAVLLASRAEDGSKVNFVAAFSPAAVKAGVQAGKVVGAVAKVCGGGGGGKPALAQAGGKDASKTAEALEVARKMLAEAL